MAEADQSRQDLVSYVDSLRLSRDVMNLMLRGRSVIDSHHGLPIHTLDASDEFLLKYGYNLENPVESAEVLGNYHESLRFMRKFFLKPEAAEGADLEIPRQFQELIDMRQLFIWAADKSMAQVIRARWSCSILRVMHAISHLDKDLRHDYFPEIQKQVFDRFYKEVHTQDGQVYLGNPKDPNSVPLDRFLTKPRKTRDSVILKLLHKKETLAEDVFDQIGVRFVTRTRVDVVRVLKYLRDRYIVMTMNIRPNRSRNNLVDPLLYRRTWRELKHQIQRGEGEGQKWVEDALDHALQEGFSQQQKEINENNPHSSKEFRSIQFTCRQLVKYRSPVADEVKALRNHLRTTDDPKVKEIFERLDFAHIAREQRFFYPFEVQIMDRSNFEESESGRASHAAYKAAQAKMAMHRVMGQLIPAAGKESAAADE